MKTYFTKIDQYLLENYPTIWNTKIVWMLLVNIIIHILFFFIGFLEKPKNQQDEKMDFSFTRAYI